MDDGDGVLNWLGGATTPSQAARAWTVEVHQRLLSIKRTVDPGDVFRFGHALGV